jgi:serine/threonine protein kinase
VLRTIDRDPLVGSNLADRYQIESVIGRGGMGVVYKARHQLMDKFMAIKMLHSHLVAEPEAVKRFHREAKTVSQVKHHHIITLYDFGMSAQRQPYLVMDYLEGTSLKNVIKENGFLPFERTERIFNQVIEALATAHSMDLVHRDLKPENIMLSRYNNEEDWVTLVDFGLSKLKDVKPLEDNNSYQITKVGDVCGSPPYMSPEQCLSSQVVDPRSDIYSLAICVYETLSGRLPFNAKSAIEMLDSHLYATPIPFNQALPELKVCTELTHVLNKGLQKEPDKRHATVEEFGAEFSDAIRRDSLKLKTYKHRLQTSEFSDLASEAEALTKTGERVSALGLKTLARPEESSLDGVQFVQDQAQSYSALPKMPKRTTDRRLLDGNAGLGEQAWIQLCMMFGIKPEQSGKSGKKAASTGHKWSHCPYCEAPAEPGIRFCLNCKHQFISPLEAAKLKKQQAMEERNNGNNGAARGFSKRAKGGGPDPKVQRAFGVMLVIALAYLGYMGLTNDSFMQMAHHLVPSLGSVSNESPSTPHRHN